MSRKGFFTTTFALLTFVVAVCSPYAAFASTAATCSDVGTPFGSGTFTCNSSPFDMNYASGNGLGASVWQAALNTSDTYTIDFDIAKTGGAYPMYIYLSPAFGTPQSVNADGHVTYTFTSSDGIQLQVGNTAFSGDITNLTICGGTFGSCGGGGGGASSTPYITDHGVVHIVDMTTVELVSSVLVSFTTVYLVLRLVAALLGSR